MKRTIVFLLLASCAGNNGHIGCWNTVSTKTNGGIERRTNHKATFCFYDDGSMEIKGDIERTGTYECSDNGKMIVITYSNGGEEVFTDIEIDGSTMKFEGRDFSVELEKE